ncbi:MAG TPA: hypothetical protein VGX23_11040 [Actinocrinis sp.]|nr:hypothetical protein [Actinocrinis sp.]
MTPRRQPDGQAGDEAVPSTDSADQGVREAERFVNHAWEELLLKRRTHMECALSAAIECCDTAYRHVAAAQREGDPTTISTAHATLEKALELVHKSSTACDRIKQAGYGELTWLDREIDEYASAVGTDQLEQRGPETGGRGHTAVRRSFWHVRRWLARALLHDRSLAPPPATTNRQHA